MKSKIGNRLKYVREEHDLSQTELAEKLGMTQKAVSSWENDRTYPRMQQLVEMCSIYNCTLEYLTGTRQHDSRDITLDDILVKMKDFDIADLHVIIDGAKFQIERIKSIREMEAENERLLRQVAEYQKKLAELKGYDTTKNTD